MNVLFAAMLGGWEIVLILAVVLILFGAKKLPELAKGLGQGIKEFKKATNDVTSEINRAMDDDDYRQPPARTDYSEQKKLKDTAPSSQASTEPESSEHKS
jgi:sec-independent protein translocase protein TatA